MLVRSVGSPSPLLALCNQSAKSAKSAKIRAGGISAVFADIADTSAGVSEHADQLDARIA
jgi:hypothetical protein